MVICPQHKYSDGSHSIVSVAYGSPFCSAFYISLLLSVFIARYRQGGIHPPPHEVMEDFIHPTKPIALEPTSGVALGKNLPVPCQG